MSAQVHLAVDIMSGDNGLRINLPASLQVLRENSDLHLHLVGDSQAINAAIGPRLPASVSILHAPDIIPMDIKPSEVLRRGDSSSMRGALKLLVNGQVEGVVSAGNTGVLMALSRQLIKMLPGYSRPAFCAGLPLRSGCCYLLDLGANVDCNAEQLRQFAALGSTLASTLHHLEEPRVALLCNGTEATKGNKLIQEARLLIMADQSLNFVGFVEGDDLLQGLADVIVCDGLLGNIALKSMEGTARLLAANLKASFRKTPYRKILAMLSGPVLRELQADINPELSNGAFLLGLQGVVVKSHGASNHNSFSAALQQAARCVQHQMVPRMAHALGEKSVRTHE